MAYDDDVHELATRFPEGVLALLGLRPRGKYRVEALEVKARRRPDLVFTPERPDEPRVYVEWQAYVDPAIERRLLEEVVIHCVQTDTFAPVVAAIVYTAPQHRAAALSADIGGSTGDVVCFTPLRVVLPELRPDDLLAVGGQALIALPLVGAEDRVKTDARAWLREVRSGAATDAERARATDLFVRLMAWRLSTMDLKHVLGEEDVVRETATGRALLAEGEARGEATGEARGEARGRAAERRRTVLLALELRLGTVPPWVAPRLEEEQNLDHLDALIEAARRIESEAELTGLFGAND